MSDGEGRGGGPRWTNPKGLVQPAGAPARTDSAAAAPAAGPPATEAEPRTPGAVKLQDLVTSDRPPPSTPAADAAPGPVPAAQPDTSPAASEAATSPRVVEVGPVGAGPVRLGWSDPEPRPTGVPLVGESAPLRSPEPTVAAEDRSAPSSVPLDGKTGTLRAPEPPAAGGPDRRSEPPVRPPAAASLPSEESRIRSAAGSVRPTLIDDYETEPPPERRAAREPLPDPRQAPARSGGRPLVLGVAALTGVGLLALLLLWATLRGDDGGEERAATAGPTSESTQAAEPPAPAAVQAPDREAVRAAYAEAARLYQAEQVSGLTQAGQRCFAGLGRGSAYRDLDYCLAFDAFGAAFAHREAGAPAPPQSYFGQTETRALQVGETVMAGAGDPGARLVQIRQLALEIAREGAPAYAQADPPAAPPPDSRAPPPEPTPAPASSQSARPPAPPVRSAEPAARPPAPVRRAAPAPAPRPEPSGEIDREAYAAARRAEAGPTAAEVAAARPQAGRGPSFNCRYARSASERLVCDDPRLAALDRRLNAAYEDAIAAGVSRRRLRAEQDNWLLTREHAAPDPDAVEDAYRRRIEELRSLQ